MITITISLFQLLGVLAIFSYNFYMIKKGKSILYDLSTGVKCYNCKSETGHQRNTIEDMSNTKNFKLCKSCERDQKLDNLVNKFRFDKIKFKKFALSDKFNKKLIFYFLGYIAFCILIDVFLSYFFKVNFMTKTLNLCSLVFSLFTLYRTKLTME